MAYRLTVQGLSAARAKDRAVVERYLTRFGVPYLPSCADQHGRCEEPHPVRSLLGQSVGAVLDWLQPVYGGSYRLSG